VFPSTFIDTILDPGLDFLWALGGPTLSNAARQNMLCIAMQESGPGLEARYQNSPSASAGAAKGWWQFEQGGGVHGVMTHEASSSLARRLCDACFVQFNEAAVWRAIEGHDKLACGFARLLIWTDPYPLPTREADGWAMYEQRLWRPGKPRRADWTINWVNAASELAPPPPV